MKERRKTTQKDWLFFIAKHIIKTNKAYKGIDRRK